MEKPMYEKLFIGGDLSGIQKFLYNISSKKAAVSLKGRSAYLSDFMRGVYEELKNKLQGAVEDIYCSGGKFYLLAADTKDNRLAIERMAQEKAVELWKEHRGALGLSIRYVPFTENADGTLYVEGENHEKVGILWKTISELFYRDKQQRLKDHLKDNYSAFFEPIELEGSPKVCIVTGIESKACVPSGFGDNSYVLPSVKDQIEKGQDLSEREDIKDFETYADKTYLGILRMDVDGLGKRFANPGFETISAYKQFSDRLKTFFEEELKTIQQKDYKKHLCLIYAGGDDVFAVGRWDKVIDFAKRIHNEVKTRFAEDGLSISGGMVIVKPKYPIAKAAEKAGEAEEAAKHFRNGEKNAFCLFGRAVSWNGEFDVVKKYYKDKFYNLVKSDGLDRSLLHKVMLYASIAEKNEQRKQEGKPLDYSYYWHASYYLARFAKRNEKNEKVNDLCDELRTMVINDARKLQLVALGARWAELRLRMENTKDNKQ